MLRLRGSSKAGRRLFHTGNTSATAAPNAEESSRLIKETTQPARLWAMQRVSQKKNHLDRATRAWRIPACLDVTRDSCPAAVGPLLYVDRLQVHQFYWKLGLPDFLCTKFCMDIYERSWEERYSDSKIVTSIDVYPQKMNKDEEDDIINLILVRSNQWGVRSPIRFFGEQQCIGVKKGGILKKSLTYLAFECDLDLPAPKISLDVSNLDIGERVTIQDLNLKLDLRWNLQPSTVICEVLPGSSEEVLGGSE